MNASNRNQPCACGSGLKWKKCHGTPEVQLRERKEKEEREAEEFRVQREKYLAEMKARRCALPHGLPSYLFMAKLAEAIGQPHLCLHPLRS